MPKKRFQGGRCGGHVVKGTSMRRKMRIGDRKNGESALQMSVAALRKYVMEAGMHRPRDVHKARKALQLRGIELLVLS